MTEAPRRSAGPKPPAAPDGSLEGLREGAEGRRLLSFYDRLRERIRAAIESRGGRWSQRTVDALLLVPDVFVLLVRLALDREVPEDTRKMIWGALAYFLLPMDLLPEAFLGGAGFLDDLVLACAVLARAMGPEMDPFVARYWNGARSLPSVLRDVTSSGEALLGKGLSRRLEKLFNRRRGAAADA